MPGAAILTRTPLLGSGGIAGVFAEGSVVALDVLPALGADLHPINYAVAAMPSSSQGHVVLTGWSTVRLAAGISAAATSMTVTDTTGTPDAPFEVVIGTEVITVGAKAGTSWSSLTRAGRGTTARRHLAGAKVASRPHTVVITDGVTTWDYTARWGRRRHAKRTTLSPGGYGEFSFSVMDRPTLTAPPTLGAEVTVSDAAGAIWHGIVDDVDVAWRANGSAEVFITCRGYAVTATDDVYLMSKTFPAYTPIYTILRDIRNDLCPLISSDNSKLYGGLRSILVESPNMIGKTAQEAWREIAAQGDSNGWPILWHIWRNGAGDPVFETIIKTSRIRAYSVALANTLGVRARYARGRVRNRIAVGFSAGYATAEGDTTSVGARRSLWVQAQNQLDSYGVAKQVAQTMLTAYEDVVPQADSIVIPYRPTETMVTDDITGYPIPLWRVDAGSFLTITGIATGNAKLPVPETFFVKSTEWDYDRLTLTLQTEELITLEGLTGQFLKSETQRPDSPIHTPPPGAPVNVPDNALSPNLSSNIPSASTDNRLNTRKLAEGLDKITLYAVYGDGVTEFSEDDVGAFGYMAHVTPHKLISVLVERDNAEHTAGSLAVTLEKVAAPASEDDAPAGTTLTTVIISEGFRKTFDFEQTVNDNENLDVHMTPEDRLRWSIAATPTPTTTSLLTIKVYAQRMTGQQALPTKVDPTIKSVSVAGAGAGVVTATILTNENAEVQVEYGESTDYGSFTPVSQMHTTHTITIRGLAQGVTYFYRVRLVDSHGNANANAQAGTFTT